MWQYLFLTYLAVLINSCYYLKNIEFIDKITFFFSMATFLVYGMFYLSPVLILILFFNFLLDRKLKIRKFWFFYVPLVICSSLTQIFIYADRTIFGMYGFHINGFVWNIVVTPGGLDSLGGGNSTTFAFALIMLGYLVLQIVLMVSLLYVRRFEGFRSGLKHGLLAGSLVVFLVGASVFQAVTYGLANFYQISSILVASNSFPLYIPVRFKHLATSLGLKASENTEVRLTIDDSLALNYPLADINRIPSAKNYNIIWLVAESLRGDMLDPEIMPSTWEFSGKSACFKNHYSSGNGTRMGIFGMFYGLYGNYWFKFLNEHRSPILMDLLQENNYQLSMYSSAKFSYPEFDQTVFANIPSADLHDGLQGEGWQRDRQNVADLLSFIDKHDPSRPFMTFMFFESPHARYYFPPENVIREPYLEDFNYATADIAKDIQLIKNRYINSCNHLDSQFERIFKYLNEHDLLSSTIVIVTGDHGEEFMEKGHWGHNSTFNWEQTHVPMIMWIPGKEPVEITRMTSHLDIPATVMKVLGVDNDPACYSLGYDLFGSKFREYRILSSWNTIGYADSELKAVFNMRGYGVFNQDVTTAADEEVEDSGLFYSKRKGELLEVMKGMGRFNSNGNNQHVNAKINASVR